MKSKFFYMKLLGLLTVIIGFSYCLTSFYNFFDTIFGNRVISAGTNIIIMSLSLIYPLFLFIFGVFFYFYADICKEKSSKWVFISIIIIMLTGLINLISNIKLLSFLVSFVHISFSYWNFIFVILYLYGKIRYKY